MRNSPPGISINRVLSLPIGRTGSGVGNGVVVGVSEGNGGGDPGVAVGAACIASASGGNVGSPGAGGVTVGSLLTSHVAMIARVGVEAAVDVEISVGVGPLDGAGKSEGSTRLTMISNNPNPINNHKRALDMRRSL